MTKDTKLKFIITIIGALSVATLEPILMFEGSLALLIFPISWLTNFLETPADESKKLKHTTKVNIFITIIGVLLIATKVPLLVACGFLSVLIFPIQWFTEFVDPPIDPSKA